MTDLGATAGLTPEQVELLLRRLKRAQPAAANAEAILPRPRDGRDPPASVAQEQLWLFDRVDPGNSAFNLLYPVRLRGPLDVDALSRAFDEVVRRHEALRTTFPEVDGLPVQRIHPPWAVRLAVHDVAGVEPERREEALQALVMREFLRPFDVGALPLVWWGLVRVGPGDHVLTVVEHHFVHDGWFRDQQLIEDATSLRDIPAVIVQGRYDICTPIMTAWDLHRSWPEAELIVVDDAGHSASEPGIAAALVAACDDDDFVALADLVHAVSSILGPRVRALRARAR